MFIIYSIRYIGRDILASLRGEVNIFDSNLIAYIYWMKLLRVRFMVNTIKNLILRKTVRKEYMQLNARINIYNSIS